MYYNCEERSCSSGNEAPPRASPLNVGYAQSVAQPSPPERSHHHMRARYPAHASPPMFTPRVLAQDTQNMPTNRTTGKIGNNSGTKSAILIAGARTAAPPRNGRGGSAKVRSWKTNRSETLNRTTLLLTIVRARYALLKDNSYSGLITSFL